EIGKAAIGHHAETPRHLGEIRRDQLERRGAVKHRMLIDIGDGGKGGPRGRPDFGRGHEERLSAGMLSSRLFRRGRAHSPPKDGVAFAPLPGHDDGGNKKPRPRGRGLNWSAEFSGQSRWPSSCKSSVNRLMKFKYSDSAPVIAARSATSPPCEA